MVIASVAGLILGGVAALVQPAQYRSTTTVMLEVPSVGGTNELNSVGNYVNSVVKTYARVASSPIVTSKVKQELSLTESPEAIAKWISTDVELNTRLITISVSHHDPKTARDVAQSTANNLESTVQDVAPKQNGVASLTVTNTQPAVTPLGAYAPSVPMHMMAGFAVALGLCVLFLVLRELLDTRIRDEEVLSETVDLPILAAVPDDPEGAGKPLAIAGKSARSEAFRQLRTNLQYIDYTGGLRSLVITSPNSSEGKTSTAVNLAEATTALGVSVLLVDADLRRPRVHEQLGIEGAVGLSTVLAGLADPREVVQQYGTKGMYVLPAGHVPPNPSELLGSQSMAHLLNELCDIFDLVILDAAPVIPVTDPTVLSMLTDGAVVVANAKKTTRHALERTVHTLSGAGVTLLGTVLNQAPHKASAYYDAIPTAGADDSVKRWAQRRAETKAQTAPAPQPAPQQAPQPAPQQAPPAAAPAHHQPPAQPPTQ